MNLREAIMDKTVQLKKYSMRIEKGQQFFEDHEVVESFPKYFKAVEAKAEILVDIPEVIEDSVEDKVEVEHLSGFKSKKALEEYGKLFGIDLNRQKTMKNMYADLVEFVK